MEYFTSLYDDNRWIKWKDFVGREKAGDQAQNTLYPNLKLIEVNTNTSTLKPIHETKTINELHQNQSSKAELRNINSNHHHSHNLLHQRGAGGEHHSQRNLHLKSRIVRHNDGRQPRNPIAKE